MKFSKGHKLFLASNTIVAFSMAVSSTFFNIFVYRYTSSSIEMMILFNAIKYLTVPGAFVIGAYLTKKISLLRIFGISMLMYMFMLIAAITLSTYKVIGYIPFVLLIGILWGIGDGLYWMSFNSLQQILMKGKIRTRFIAIYSSLSGAASIAAPTFSTMSIGLFGIKGYLFIFTIILVYYITAFSLILKIDLPKDENINIDFLNKVEYKKYKKLKFNFVLNTIVGFREGIGISFLSLMYINAFNNNDIFYGSFTTAAAILLVFSNYAAGRIYHSNYKNIFFIISSFMLVTASCFFGIVNSKVSAVAYGIIYNLTFPMYYIPITVLSFSIIDYCSKTRGEIYVNMTAREAGINFGRLISLLTTLICVKLFNNGLNFAFTVTNFTIIIVVLLCYTYKK